MGSMLPCISIYSSTMDPMAMVITNSSPWKDPPFLMGKSTISMGHLYHGELLNNQRVISVREIVHLDSFGTYAI